LALPQKLNSIYTPLPGRFQHQLIPSGGAHSHFLAEIIIHLKSGIVNLFEFFKLVILDQSITLELHTIYRGDIVPSASVADYRYGPGRAIRDIQTTEHRTSPGGPLRRDHKIKADTRHQLAATGTAYDVIHGT
jgi:hypothetical protein